MPVIKNLEELNDMAARLQAVLPGTMSRKPDSLVIAYYTFEQAAWKFYIGGYVPNDGCGDPLFLGYADVDNCFMMWSLGQMGTHFNQLIRSTPPMIIEFLEWPMFVKDVVLPGSEFNNYYPPPRFVEG